MEFDERLEDDTATPFKTSATGVVLWEESRGLFPRMNWNHHEVKSNQMFSDSDFRSEDKSPAMRTKLSNEEKM